MSAFNEFVVLKYIFHCFRFLEVFHGTFDCWKNLTIVRIKRRSKWLDLGFWYVLFSVWNFKSDFAGCFNTSFYNFTWVLLICYDCFWLTYYSSSDLSIFVGLKKRVCFLHTRFWVVWIKWNKRFRIFWFVITWRYISMVISPWL